MRGLIGYQVLNQMSPALHRQEGPLFDYVLGSNGVFLQARSERLAVSLPIAPAREPLRGLNPVIETFYMNTPKVPHSLLGCLLQRAGQWAEAQKEVLFHLTYSPVYPVFEGWAMQEPAQIRTAVSCRPTEDGLGSSHDRALIELHSHHGMPAQFSRQDDQDETGFRIYVVIGDYPNWKINVRVGVYGHFWPIPARLVFEDFGQIDDVNAPKTGGSHD